MAKKKKASKEEPKGITIADLKKRLYVELNDVEITDEVARVVAAGMDEAAQRLFAEAFTGGFTAQATYSGDDLRHESLEAMLVGMSARRAKSEGERLCDGVQRWLDDMEGEE